MPKKLAIVMFVVAILAAILIVGLAGETSAAPPLDPAAVRAAAVQAGMGSLSDVGVPQVNNLGDFLNPGLGPKSMAIVLGKALFWDMQVGSDGQSCGSCHFDGGADNRTKNQLSPGLKSSPPDTTFGNSTIPGVTGWPQFSPNYELLAEDFPIFKLNDPQQEDYNHRVILHDGNDVVSSQGVFKANFTGIVPGQLKDNGTAVVDDIFRVGDVNVRRVEPRNTSSVINAVFYFDNFWDGRARNQFNGVNPFGPLDETARILVKVNGTLTPTQVSIPNSSLASQAVGPPLSDIEMSFVGRTFPDIGKKMLAAKPLAFQNVHPEDSVLGPYAVTGNGANGLTFATYADMVRIVFQSKYWDSTSVITFNPDGSRVINPPGTPGGYTQMETNFSLFFGLAVQAYEATLVSNETRFDKFMEGDNSALDQDELAGLLTFINQGTLAQAANPLFNGIGQGSCVSCHKSATFSDATFTGMGIEGPIEVEKAPVMLDGRITLGTELVLLDNGFYNIGVRPTSEDLGRGANEMGKPLSASRQALQGFPFAPRVPANAPQSPRVMVDGAFKVPSLRNVELTGPYFHNGGMINLRSVIDFYRRQGDFGSVNIASLDGPMAAVQLTKVDSTGRDVNGDRLVKFLLALTDERVRMEMAPFDHPQLFLPNGHAGNSVSIPADQVDLINGVKQAKDNLLEIPAVGHNGRQVTDPVRSFLSTGAIQGINLTLTPGWNIFSVPVRLHTSIDTWGEFATHNGLSFQAAYRWDGTAFQFVDNAYVLTPLDAIYVRMNNSATLEIIPFEGTTAPPSKTLSAGWNLIGSAFLQTEMPVKDAVASAFFAPTPGVPNASPLWGYSQIVSPTANTFDWVYVREAPVIPNVLIGEGYWVFMVNSGQLSGFTSTPLLRPR